MKINLLVFGIARDILGYAQHEMSIQSDMRIQDLKHKLSEEYPDFKKLAKFDIAVNQEYQEDSFVLSERDEVAIIPPVSGG
ncbi:molybdopterin converting factor subunit 1 [Portibacter marinus]|uniref:molybdopterin converting factor subunit 1 n=1 Tax=Portibacter marinus TaxID=2898660 RepID=UPI001F45E813|nr:molybdopterin converting factor subunit 1 [Portibacter marinus]